MLDRELDKFWENDEKAHRDNCFAVESQIAFGIRMSDECVFWELGEEGEPWGYTPRERRLDLNRRYNDKAEKIVGRRLLKEELPPEDAAFPYVKRIGEVLGSEYALENGTEWLKKSIYDEEQLEQVLDRVEKLDLREFMLPPNWESEKKRIYEKYGLLPPRMHWVRGPVTLACSLMGTTEFLYFLADEDELAERFSSVMADVIIKMAEIMDAEAGRTGADERGFGFADDNCCLLSPALYKKFGYPVLKKVFARFSPDEGDERFQHSDSAMGHLLPLLGEMNLTGCNFGPTVLVPEIRKYLPKARIDGCIAPFTFMHNDEKQLTYETLRDIEAGKQYGGVNIWTAGSINNGSSLKSMRLMMDLVWDNQR